MSFEDKIWLRQATSITGDIINRFRIFECSGKTVAGIICNLARSLFTCRSQDLFPFTENAASGTPYRVTMTVLPDKFRFYLTAAANKYFCGHHKVPEKNRASRMERTKTDPV